MEQTILNYLQEGNIYTLAEAAELLQVKPDTLQKQCQRGQRDAFQIGSGKRTFWLVRIYK